MTDNEERAIPTCVGTTGHREHAVGRNPGHPHMRGDYHFSSPLVLMNSGPSPHAWGLRSALPAPWGAVRAIPTCVGTTRSGALWPHPEPGHPHMRGDYRVSSIASFTRTGPSPHAWGLRIGL
ncbi:conserved hypothetical protein [Thermus scotoductus SA-01]|uniref:Uncharacterized protein n=1 Tax=Thermus scotoductus (strain ATCC 700910 / SA-01) TaxID=743525 RepID=E8PQU2_THESS|nr:conserved hypothetical protein [Thermus scotoductus SA-01]